MNDVARIVLTLLAVAVTSVAVIIAVLIFGVWMLWYVFGGGEDVE